MNLFIIKTSVNRTNCCKSFKYNALLHVAHTDRAFFITVLTDLEVSGSEGTQLLKYITWSGANLKFLLCLSTNQQWHKGVTEVKFHAILTSASDSGE